ncbi:MAG: alpha/beta fold hydrolase [Candidatus Lokiarchaeota archaeon]|nr:alpha/beta fold hydrolase [Candidatus Lokiarchaeota archaeon]
MQMYGILWGIYIVSIIAAIVITIFLIKIYLKRWTKIEFPDVIMREKIEIPIPRRNSHLRGEIYKRHNLEFPAPTVIVAHGWVSKHENLDWINIPLAMAGYAVLAYDHYGHGINPGNIKDPEIILDIIKDLKEIVDFIEEREDLDNFRIGLVGFSLGGLVALTQGYKDPRIRVVIANCAPNDAKSALVNMTLFNKFLFKFFLKMNVNPTEEQRAFVSPKNYLLEPLYPGKKIFLAHCKNDPIIRISEFEKNRELLNLSEDRYVLFEKGGHHFFGQETLLTAQILKWVKENLN